MSLHKFAEQVAANGRGDDSLLVHMTPDEVQRLQAFAEANGTTLTINPTTGLPEAGLLSDLFKAVAPIALGAFLGPAGMGLTFGGLSSAVSAGIATGGITALATGSLSRGLMAGLGAYGGAGLGESLMNAGTGALGDAAASSAYGANAGMTDLAAQELGFASAEEAAQNAAAQSMRSFDPSQVSGFDKVSAGFDAATSSPSAMGSFAKDNWKYLAGAAAPIAADMMVPTTVKQPDITGNDTINQFIYGPNGQYRRLNPVPAKNYGTPAWKPFAAGGIVALAAGGLDNIYANLGGKDVYDKIAGDYLKAGGNESGLASIFSKYDTPVAPPAAAPTAVANKTSTTQSDADRALALMYQASTGGVNTSAFDSLGGYDAAKKLAASAGYSAEDSWIDNYAKTNNLSNTSNTTAAVTSPSAYSNPAFVQNNSTYTPTDLGYSEFDLNNYVKSDAAKTLSRLSGENITAESYINDALKTGRQYATMSGVFSPEEIAKMSNKQLLAANELFTQGGGTRANNGYSQQDVDFIRNEANAYKGLLWSPNFQAIGGAGELVGNQAKNAATTAADTTGIATLNRTDAGADTRLDFTGDGTSTVKPINTAGTYTGTTTTAPPIGTTIGQGTYVGQGSKSTTGTTGGIMDFGGKSAFGATSPLALAKQQIADESAAKTSANNAKMDLYRQWVTQNPKATDLEHANFLDKVGLDAATAAQVTPLSADQMQSRYYDAKFNKQTGDSMAAYNYLMGKGAYPTKSNVGEIARPYAEATLGYPASTNKQYLYDQATGRYIRNPDYVAEYQDPSGGVNYLLSPSEIYQYFKTNAGQDDATTYAWAIENNLTPQEIAAATGVPISQVAAKWRAAKAKQATAAADKKAADDKAAAASSQQDLSSTGLAAGGMATYAVGGGLGSLGSYSDGGRLLKGPGDGVSDSIPATIGQKQQPARLADGEFVIPARIVSELGNGSTDAGAKKLYAMMDRVQRARGKTTGKNKVAANSRADKYLPA